MTADQIQDLITDVLISNEEFKNDFCRDCESITLEEGFNWCLCDFNPADYLCVKSGEWEKIADAIAKVADLAEAPEYTGEEGEQADYEAEEADRAYEYARDN